jgi:hypothetical protein
MRSGDAKQGITMAFIAGAEGFILVRSMRHAAVQQFAPARTAGAVFAAVGQSDAGPDGRAENGFVRFAMKLMTAWLYSDLETHTILINEKTICCYIYIAYAYVYVDIYIDNRI